MGKQRSTMMVVAALALGASLLPGCSRDDHENPKYVGSQRRILLNEMDRLYGQYVSTNANAARQSLLQGIALLEKDTYLDQDVRADIMELEFSRLAVLECKVGTKDLADYLKN